MKHKAHGLMFGFALILAAALVTMGCSNDDPPEEKDTIGLHGGVFADKTNDLKTALGVYKITFTAGCGTNGNVTVTIPGVTDSGIVCAVTTSASSAANVATVVQAALAADTTNFTPFYTARASGADVILIPVANAAKSATAIPAVAPASTGVTATVAAPANIWAVEITGTRALATLTATTTFTTPSATVAAVDIPQDKTAAEAAALILAKITAASIANHTAEVKTIGGKSFIVLYKDDLSALTGVSAKIELAVKAE